MIFKFRVCKGSLHAKLLSHLKWLIIQASQSILYAFKIHLQCIHQIYNLFRRQIQPMCICRKSHGQLLKSQNNVVNYFGNISEILKFDLSYVNYLLGIQVLNSSNHIEVAGKRL